MSHSLVRRLWPALVVLCGLFAAPASAQVVISQVYGGGGNSGAPYTNDYVELFNSGSTPASLSGLSVQYTSATGTGNFGANTGLIVVLPAATLDPGAYFLVGLAGGTNGVALPTPDATGTINMAGAAGKVALVNSTVSLGCNGSSTPCDASQQALIVDLVGFGNANFFEGAGAAPTLSNTLAAFRDADGCTDTNDNAADFAALAPAPRNGSALPNPCDGGGTLFLSIGNTSAAEGNSGTTPFFFTISLNQPAGEDGASVDWATADGTATVADDDYIPGSGTVTFAEGQSSVTISVDVVGDDTTEPDETFFVNLTNPVGAEIFVAQGVGTILNDDVATVAIHAIQGSGQISPYDGLQVATTGIVTGRKNNGFFIQTPDGQDDGDPATSEGLFVFTSSTPPAAAEVGSLVLVQGTVTEYVPAADPHQLPLTEIVNATVTQLSTGHPLPTPVVLTVDMPTAEGGLDQLEHLEGMRVTIPSATVVAPTGGNTNETQATATSNGRFAVVVTGTARPMREPGIQVPDPDPLGSTATNIPRWDYNPETIAVNSTTIGAPTANLAAGCTITDGTLTGPLDYTFRRFVIYPEGELASDCSNAAPTPATLPTPDHATFATYNLERFFDTVSNPGTSEPVLTAAALERRLNKASIGIRDYLHAPDILGVTETENQSVLQALADRINADAIANGQPDPGYVAYLEEGLDVGGIDVGFLVKAGEVAAGVARVEVLSVEQVGADAVLQNPNGSTSVLNDRPPLVLDAVVNFADGRSVPVTTIVVHQRSLSGVADDTGGSSGWSSTGERVRAKRQAQADYLATLVNDMQDADPARKIVVLGDFNAFEFNDGYVDAMGTVTGLPSADDETAVEGDGADLVEPNLFNLTLMAAAEDRYSFVFDYQAQTLDHVLVNEAILASPLVTGLDISHARINADFPEVARNDADTPTRLSDHDPTMLLMRIAAVAFADISVEVEALEAEVVAGETMEFGAIVANAGTDDATFPGVGLVLDAELADVLVSAPEGWDCDAPDIAGGNTTVACATDTLAAGGEAVFALVATAPESRIGGTVTLAAAATSQTEDPDEANNAASTSVNVIEDPVSAIPELFNAVPVTGLSGAEGGEVVYRIELPAGATMLRLMSYGGSGDVTLYASRGEIPTTADYDARSLRPGNNETITITAPQPGTWYVKLVGVRAFANVSLRGNFNP
ncbi:nuclease [Luteimonas aestuarii]|uniref:Nuclease n=1 Tax=Luteimonas aestuarii TaxID=453837 RepID=A0A4R5TTL7_9GAMM|nr:pre-peptidase C-terminal domain-containing protein [Luteimonas aestuarii]TDK24331.1 nuclease [Luteimonas aestuarii]